MMFSCTCILILAASVAIPTVTVLIEVVYALRTTGPVPFDRSIARVTVLIPAHNEADQIAQTVTSMQRQLREGDSILVVADNCTDATAAIARECGAGVLERVDALKRGKGYALAAGTDHLAPSPPDVVVVMDADMTLSPGAVATLVGASRYTSQPIQATDVLEPPEGALATDRISAFAFAFKNQVRALGAERLGIPCLLRGTGMAFPWPILSTAKLATGNIVEDMQLGIDLAVAGYHPHFCPSARVTGKLPSSSNAANSQRKRWEHGHLQTILRNCPRLLWEGIRQARPSLIGLAMDLAVPPLSLLVTIWALMVAVAALTTATHLTSLLPFYILAAEGALLAASILLAWVRFGRETVPFATLLCVPLYVLMKIPLYVGFLFRRQKAWVRTART